MYIAGGQQLALPCLQPAVAGISLALWAMPVAARVVGDGGRLSAAGTAITVSAERSGTASGDGQQDLDMGPADPLAVALEKSCSGRAIALTSMAGSPLEDNESN